MATTLLPRFLVLKSDGKYLNVLENLHEELPSGFLKFNEEQIWSPRVKFAVEQAETGDGRFVHIRSCYNNKYWVADRIQQLLWIVAAGDKPEEDQSKDSCTLFEPLTSSGNGTVRLRHVQTEMTLINESLDPSSIFQGVEVSLATSGTLFDVIDWETLVMLPSLPSQISFRSEELDGNYLCSRKLDQWYQYQRFESGLDIGDSLVVAKVLCPTPDGNYRIKDVHFGQFWRRNSNWIWANAEDNNNDTIFSIVKLSDNVIALRNLGNNNFCGAVTKEGKTNCLTAEYPTISRQTRLMVEEFGVLQREISDVRYRLSDSRIYQEEIQEVDHAFATNNSQEHESSITLSYSTSESRTTHWTNSVSIALGVSVTFNTAIIPFIASGEVEVSTEVGYSYEWGVSTTTERTRTASYAVVVPPGKSYKVTLMCTTAKCDVPFSYIQRDLLTTGERVTTLKDDGIYTGINSYNFNFEDKETSSNNSPEHESKVTLTYKTFDSRTTHWTNSLSITLDASVDFKIAEIPYIESGKVKVSTEIDYFSEWRVSKKTEHTREACYTVVVPPLTKIKVTLKCTKGNCDVPFSYIQRDLLTTGERVTTLKDDGIYTGYNSYNFHFQSSEVTNDA